VLGHHLLVLGHHLLVLGHHLLVLGHHLLVLVGYRQDADPHTLVKLN
jgi:hypothetical protein